MAVPMGDCLGLTACDHTKKEAIISIRSLCIDIGTRIRLLSSCAVGIPRTTEGSAVAHLPTITEASEIGQIARSWDRPHDYSIAHTYGIIIDLGEGLRGVGHDVAWRWAW